MQDRIVEESGVHIASNEHAIPVVSNNGLHASTCSTILRILSLKVTITVHLNAVNVTLFKEHHDQEAPTKLNLAMLPILR